MWLARPTWPWLLLARLGAYVLGAHPLNRALISAGWWNRNTLTRVATGGGQRCGELLMYAGEHRDMLSDRQAGKPSELYVDPIELAWWELVGRWRCSHQRISRLWC